MEGEEVKVYIYSFSPPLCLEGHFQPNPTCLPSGFSSATSHPAPTWFTLPPSFFLRHLHVSDAAFSIFSVACFHFCLHLQTMSPHVHFFNKMYCHGCVSVTPLRSRFTKVIRYHPRGTFKGPMPQWGIGGPKQEHTAEERLFQE